ncbi:MAG: lysophospholipid transporter LplT [Sulfuriferula sp.]|nr:lysophospholipid transporter LplT [Sulfuriferula sp.]
MSQGSLNLNLNAKPMLALLGAQFLSALADNALLIAAIALMKILGQADRISWVQAGFVLPFILLAPFVGVFADALPKGRVMLIGNAIKLIGTVLMLQGVYPAVAYLIAGIGAAVYSPAKYGILSQFFNTDKLVKANGWLEGSTIVAILLGVVLGGMLADNSIRIALMNVAAIYAAAAVINLFIPRIYPEHVAEKWQLLKLIKEFWGILRTLLREPAARMSLIGTSLFWGSGATLRLMLFVWVPVALGISDNRTPANLMGALSVGIVIGAAMASLLIKLEHVRRAYIGGLLIGPIIVLLALQTGLSPAVLLLMALGAAGGVFVVPLNALLQQVGHQSVGTGHALAIQNLFENMAMLLLVSSYGMAAKAPVTQTVVGFGVLMFAGVAALAWTTRQNRKII